jgi:hypothetical protein
MAVTTSGGFLQSDDGGLAVRGVNVLFPKRVLQPFLDRITKKLFRSLAHKRELKRTCMGLPHDGLNVVYEISQLFPFLVALDAGPAFIVVEDRPLSEKAYRDRDCNRRSGQSDEVLNRSIDPFGLKTEVGRISDDDGSGDEAGCQGTGKAG